MRLIDADALIRLTSARGFRGNKFAEVIKAYVDEMPTIEERKTGKWKWDLADNGWADWTCSECGYVKNTDIHVTLDWDYCPNCGARMVE